MSKNNSRRYHVTTILNLMEKYALRSWTGRVTAEYIVNRLNEGKLTTEEIKEDPKKIVKDATAEAKRIAKEAADKGKRVHELAEQMFQQMINKEDIEIEVDSDIKKPFQALVDFVKEHHVQPIATEIDVEYPKEGDEEEEEIYYKGRFDLIAYVDGVPMLIDLKTTGGIWDDHPLQIAGYLYAYNATGEGIPIRFGGIIRLDKETGFPEFRPYSYDEMKSYAKEFLLWAKIYCLRERRKKEARERKKQIKAGEF